MPFPTLSQEAQHFRLSGREKECGPESKTERSRFHERLAFMFSAGKGNLWELWFTSIFTECSLGKKSLLVTLSELSELSLESTTSSASKTIQTFCTQQERNHMMD